MREAEVPSSSEVVSEAEPPKVWRVLLAMAITVAVMYLLFTKVGDAQTSAQALADARWELIGVPLALLAGILAIGVWKWRIIIRALGHDLPFREALVAFLASMPVAAITPSRAGDFLRATMIVRRVPLWRGLGSVLADRLVDVQSLCLLAICGAFVTQQWVEGALIAAGLALAWGAMLLMLRFRKPLLLRLRRSKLRESIDELLEAFVALLRQPRLLFLQLFGSVLTWGAVLGVFFSLTVMFRCDLGPAEVCALWPLATLFGLIPLTLAGMGTRDAAFVYLLGLYGHANVEESRVLLATFGYSLLSSWMWAVIGLPFTIRWVARGAKGRP